MNRARRLALYNLQKIKPTLLDSEIGSKLPEAYKKFYREWVLTQPQPVHYIPFTGSIWYRDEKTGEVKRRENYPLPTRFSKELHDVFLGGELIIQGFIKKHKKRQKVPKFWMPQVEKSAIYSEILDKYFSALMTKRAIDLIHEHHGLDAYLLQTKACDLKTMVALKLKQRLLVALSTKNLPYDEEKNNEIYKKYEQYLIPPEEIEWYGLNFTEACRKFKEMEEAKENAPKIPLKHIFRAELIKQLQDKPSKPTQEANNQTSAQSSLLSKIPGFDKFKKKTT